MYNSCVTFRKCLSFLEFRYIKKSSLHDPRIFPQHFVFVNFVKSSALPPCFYEAMTDEHEIEIFNLSLSFRGLWK